MSGIKRREWNERNVLDFLNENTIGRAIFYEELETSDTSNSYDVYCGTAQLPLHGSRSVRNTCSSILNYLENIYSESDHTTDTYDVCKLLNYWVYNRLKILLHSYDSNYIIRAHGDIVRKWNDFNELKLKKDENKTCKPISNIIAYNDWDKRKELYEYYVDYSPIYQLLRFFPDKCNEFYHYVESKKPLYEHFKKHCSSNRNDWCNEFYTKYEEYDPDKVLSTFECHQKIIDERAAAASEDPQKVDTFPAGETNPKAPPADTLPRSTQNLPEKSHTVTKIGNVLLGVVATSMTSGVLYRFTPLGRRLRSGYGSNRNIVSNLNGADNGLFYYASESYNPYSGHGEEHYMGYHPA
ncbi:Plasmodium vivax Vir protein, putative [Plasmodium vivax]|uniref:Vir protein, putative n=1 Tax=Plasmodium vivax TaxID=5855 RepID=A0A1G4EC74_PLAVI|nr:Plasmodium vivax Vir protein, putative [Plasmodium vivax]